MVHENEVATAFDNLLKEMENAIEELHQATKALEKYDQEWGIGLAEKVSQIEALRDKAKDIQKEWDNLFLDNEQRKHDSRIIRLTEGAINNSYIGLREHKDFFPRDSIGASGKKKGKGKPLRLYVAGIAEAIDTDIAGDKMFFRWRGWSRFFDLHKLHAGDKVVIEKVSDYEYKVYPKSEQ